MPTICGVAGFAIHLSPYSSLEQSHKDFMKPIFQMSALLFVAVLFASLANAQTLTPLSTDSRFVCVGTNNKNQIGKLTTSGYRLVSTKSARTTIQAERKNFQEKLNALKDLRKAIQNDRDPSEIDLKESKGFIKKFALGKFKGSKSEKLEVLDSAVTVAAGLVALKNSEVKALSDCLNNKQPTTPAGNLTPQIFVIRNSAKAGLGVVAIIIRDAKTTPDSQYCFKEGTNPAQPLAPYSGYRFHPAPCPSGIFQEQCDGILPAGKVGALVGSYVFAGATAEDIIQSTVGRLTSEQGGKSYLVRPKTPPSKTCPEIFGE
jgi:hypothetical protein